MRIALYGGSFNPPHVVHQMVMLYVLQTRNVNEIWMIPTYRHAFGKDLAPFEDRLAMCREAIHPLGPCVKCSDIERELGGESRTLDTVRALKVRHPEHRWALVLGSDIRAETHKWKSFDLLAEEVDMIWIGRLGQGETGRDDIAFPDVSSREIRRKLKFNESVEGLLPKGVLDYARDHELYKE